MADARDWLKSLWSVSYKGVPFFFGSDEEDGGRDQVVHQFPHRDDPFVEDMGESPRYYSGAAYVHGDDVDRQTAALLAIFAAAGPGVLVLPISGPVTAHCQSFRRRHDKDKLGYVAFEVKFVREGAGAALISIPLLARQAFLAADQLAVALASQVASALQLVAVPDFVLGMAVDGVQSAIALVDAARQTNVIEPARSARLRDAADAMLGSVPALLGGSAGPDDIAALYAVLPFADALIDASAPQALAGAVIASVRELGDAMDPAQARAAMLTLADAVPWSGLVATSSSSGRLASVNADATARLLRLAAVTALVEAAVRRTYGSRPEGVTARAMVADMLDAEMAQLSGAADAALSLALEDLRGRAVEFLTRQIADLAPVITVTAARSMPSLWWSWRLYGDPNRGGELVARNRVAHPSFLPTTFQALER